MIDGWPANAGDAALSACTAKLVRDIVPGAAVLHAVEHGDRVREHYPDLNLVPPHFWLLGVSPNYPWAAGLEREWAAAVVDGADAVISQGGAFLTEAYNPLDRIRGYQALRERGVPYAFCAQSVSRFSDPWACRHLGEAFRDACWITVRDEPSRGHVIEMSGRDDNVEVTADLAFGLFPAPPAPRDQRGIAAILSSHFAVDGEAEGLTREVSIPLLARVVEGIVELAGGEPVTVFSTVQGLADLQIEDDAEYAASVIALVSPAAASRIRQIAGYIDAGETLAIISSHRAVLSMRAHPVIFGLSLGVPSMALARSAKVAALFGDHLPDGTLAPPLGDVEAVLGAVERAFSTEHRGRLLWEALAPLREAAAGNRVVVERLLAARG